MCVCVQIAHSYAGNATSTNDKHDIPTMIHRPYQTEGPLLIITSMLILSLRIKEFVRCFPQVRNSFMGISQKDQ